MKAKLIRFGIILFLPALVCAQSEDPKKSIYLFEEFSAGKVLMKSGNWEKGTLNYDTNSQEVVFKDGGKTMILTGLELMDTIYIENRKFIPAKEKVYEVLLNSKGKGLYINYTNKPRPVSATTDHKGTSKEEQNRVSNTVSSVYTLRPYKANSVVEIMKHYWLKKDNEYIKANSEKQFIKIFPAKSDQIKDFVKDNNINFYKEDDLVKLFNFCNS